MKGARLVHYRTDGAKESTRAYASGAASDAVARSLARIVKSGVTLWPTEEPNVFRAQWFDADADAYNETYVTIEE